MVSPLLRLSLVLSIPPSSSYSSSFSPSLLLLPLNLLPLTLPTTSLPTPPPLPPSPVSPLILNQHLFASYHRNSHPFFLILFHPLWWRRQRMAANSLVLNNREQESRRSVRGGRSWGSRALLT